MTLSGGMGLVLGFGWAWALAWAVAAGCACLDASQALRYLRLRWAGPWAGRGANGKQPAGYRRAGLAWMGRAWLSAVHVCVMRCADVFACVCHALRRCVRRHATVSAGREARGRSSALLASGRLSTAALQASAMHTTHLSWPCGRSQRAVTHAGHTCGRSQPGRLARTWPPHHPAGPLWTPSWGT